VDLAKSDLISSTGSSGGDTPETPRIVSPTNHSSIAGDAITLVGTARAGVTVELLDWLTVVATIVADDGAQWSITLTDVESGDHLFSAHAIGMQGVHSPQSDAVAVNVSSDDEQPESNRRDGLIKRMSAARRIATTLRGFHRPGRQDEWSDQVDSDDEWERVMRATPLPPRPDDMPSTVTITPSAPARTGDAPEQGVDDESAGAAPDYAKEPAMGTEAFAHTSRLEFIETSERPTVTVTTEELVANSEPRQVMAAALVTPTAPRMCEVQSISSHQARYVPVEIAIREIVLAPVSPRVRPVTTLEPRPVQVRVDVRPEQYDVVRVRAYSVPASPHGRHIHAVAVLSAHEGAPGWKRAFHFGFDALTRHK
jgi:hypothetical protein